MNAQKQFSEFLSRLPNKTWKVRRSNYDASRSYYDRQAKDHGYVLVIDETPEPAALPKINPEPRWTRQLSYEEQRSLSAEDFDSYFDWRMCVADRVCSIRERKQNGAEQLDADEQWDKDHAWRNE